jgi:hypothetical protein
LVRVGRKDHRPEKSTYEPDAADDERAAERHGEHAAVAGVVRAAPGVARRPNGGS